MNSKDMEELGEREGEEEEEEEQEQEEEEEQDQEEEEEKIDSNKVRCPLSDHPALYPHTLSYQFQASNHSDCFACELDIYYEGYYHCTTCVVDFHDGCHRRPKKITHPYHLQHPLTLTLLNTEYKTNNRIQTQSPFIFDRCCWCGCYPDKWVYSCSICGFCLDLPCSQKSPLLTIANPKSHHHSLLFLPRPLLVPCDACGLVIESEASYACFQCNYMVHENCINLPRVIKLTRHPHRLYFTPYLPPTIAPCRVCYRTVDTRFGQYSCNHEDCSYVIHSKCATHGEVWDGRELEWEPEEPEETEGFASFTKVGDDLIKYFFHDHYLKLEKYDGVRDARKQCEVCNLLIDDFACFYNCMECDHYSLHEVCAGLPLKWDHELHKHRLFLDPNRPDDYDSMACSACFRHSNGFKYKCFEKDCVSTGCQIDIPCILNPHNFGHESHEHLLFSSVIHGCDRCGICKDKCGKVSMRCTLCDFAMCYQCATIPTELHYKYDEHPLSLCYGESVVFGIYWCEVCEGGLNPEIWYYTCDKCCITIHRECLFGSSIYMKYDSKFYHNGYEVTIHPLLYNNSRPICNICRTRCRESVCYYVYPLEIYCCSPECLQNAKYYNTCDLYFHF